ncbi:MAG: hypothetical protein O7E52_21330 [Candidatus Poribacteria bacterium]|nr:hypothetical protein [Candidatus Poribacteria bacterium]
MRMLKFVLICCTAMILAVGCASEKKMESQSAETAPEATTTAESSVVSEEITLAVTGMT